MKFEISITPRFDRELRRLAKKFPSLRSEYILLVNSLKEDPTQGTPIGNQCFKIRLAIASKGKGKSGGARVITYVQIVKSSVYLLTIFDKSEMESIPQKELTGILKGINP